VVLIDKIAVPSGRRRELFFQRLQLLYQLSSGGEPRPEQLGRSRAVRIG
jgi:hypothetical protein